MKLNTNILYLSLYNLLRKKHKIGQPITKKEIFCELGKHFLVPKNLRQIVIFEMEKLKLLKQENSNQIILLDFEINLEKDANKFYEKFHIF